MLGYSISMWKVGENVEVVEGPFEKFLRSYPENKVSDNLEHLLNYDWMV